jgi:hypothetical protein
MRNNGWFIVEQCERIQSDGQKLMETLESVEQKELLSSIISRSIKIEAEINASGKSMYQILMG